MQDSPEPRTAKDTPAVWRSSAIAAELAAGCSLAEAVARARKYLRAGLLYGVTAGHGAGCLGHAVTMQWTEVVNG